MRIGMVLDKSFPVDDRVEKEALSLIAAGHEVHLLCFTFGKEKTAEMYNGIHLHRVYMPLAAYKKLAALILLLPFYGSFWKRHIKRFVSLNKIRILHIHDLPLCGVGLQVAKECGIPLVADMHENYPILIEEAAFANTAAGRLLINKAKWFQKEKEWLGQISHIIVVADGMRRRLQELLPNKPQFALVPNSPRIADILQTQQSVSVKPKAENGFMLFYFGGLDSIRGLETLIDATALLKDEIPNLTLRIVGSGSLRPQLEQQVRSLKLEKLVEFCGWQPVKYLGAFIADADVCIIPHLKSPQTDNSSPNKLFIYMLFNKAIITSNCRSVQEVVQQSNCGLVYDSGDTRALARRIRTLYKDDRQRQQLASNGLQAVQQKYNWDQTVTPLLDLYAGLAAKNGQEA